MLTHTQLQFLVLLRAGLWAKPVNIDELLDPEKYQSTENKNKPQNKRNNRKNTESTNNSQGIVIDWPAIYRISREQTVVGLIADAINTLPAELMPPKAIAQRFAIDKLNIERSHVKLNSVLNLVVEALNAQGIPHVLLKGQGVAQNYPNPTSRTCGDIDLYVGEEKFEPALNIIRSIEGSKESEIENEKHTSFTLKGITIEMHKYTAVMPQNKLNKLYHEWEIITIFNNTEKINIGDSIINTPPANFNMFFLFWHAFYHCMTEGVGFRHMCDLTVYLNNHYKELAKEEFILNLKKFHLTHEWKTFTSIMVEYLNLDKSKAILYDSKYRRKAIRFKDLIFFDGNFGHFNGLKTNINQTRLKRKLQTFRNNCKLFWKRLQIFPKQTLYYFARMISHGVKNIMD